MRSVSVRFLVIILAVFGSAPPARAAGIAPIVVIVMENHSYGPSDPGVLASTTKYIVGNPDAPYINDTLIPSGTLFSNYDATGADSLPNYLQMTAGTTAGCPTNACPKDSVAVENLFHLLGQAGISFDSFAQDMPSNCSLTNSGYYRAHHNPEIYFTDVDASSGLSYQCSATDIPFPASWPDPLPAFSFVVPDACHDMHGTGSTGDCPGKTDQLIRDGDAWLSENVPTFLSEGAIVLVTFDEGTSSDHTGGGGHVPTILLGPNVVVGATDAALYTHSSLLAGLETYFGLTPLLGSAANSRPLPLPTGAPLRIPAVTDVTPSTGKPGDQVTITGENLDTAWAVSFNGAPSAFSIGGATSVIATVPQEATSGPISVSTAGGTATGPSDFTVEPPPAPPPVTLMQHVLAKGLSGKNPTDAWAQPTTAGNLLVAAIGWTGSGNPVPPAGWVLAAKTAGTAIYYEQNAPQQSGSVTFPLTARGAWVMDLMEWNGVATAGALDRTATKTSKSLAGTTADSGTTPSTSQPSEVAIAAIRALAAVTESNPTNGFAQVDAGTQGSTNTMGFYVRVLSALGPQQTSVTLSASARWRGCISTFRGL